MAQSIFVWYVLVVSVFSYAYASSSSLLGDLEEATEVLKQLTELQKRDHHRLSEHPADNEDHENSESGDRRYLEDDTEESIEEFDVERAFEDWESNQPEDAGEEDMVLVKRLLVTQRGLIDSIKEAASKLYHKLFTYGKWCGAKHGYTGKGDCTCEFINRNETKPCEQYGIKDEIDRVCFDHDLCTHCTKRKFTGLFGSFATHTLVKGDNVFTFPCECQREVVQAAKAANCNGDADCKRVKAQIPQIIPKMPCACKKPSFGCFTWKTKLFPLKVTKKWSKCDAELVSEYSKCFQ